MAPGDEDNRVQLWGVGKPARILSLTGDTSSVEAAEFSQEEDCVAVGLLSGSSRICDRSKNCTRPIWSHLGGQLLGFSTFLYFVVSSSIDTFVKLCSVSRQGCINIYQGHSGLVNVACSVHYEIEIKPPYLLRGNTASLQRLVSDNVFTEFVQNAADSKLDTVIRATRADTPNVAAGPPESVWLACVRKTHNPFTTVMSTRVEGIIEVAIMRTRDNVRTAVKAALTMDEPAVVFDFLGILTQNSKL
ncbi:hypothetical protein CSKR_107861 [Clonorchis sinensis]|uniref:Katanin p80 subunit C-terminal domain-containing protein n=1 Tax=Clonorchis sinensis TaxID=79923 RepID=A0A419PIA7_CLOSI|nr:hypothetical protein CSKR_107861 [Clonorchis sinensis]